MRGRGEEGRGGEGEGEGPPVGNILGPLGEVVDAGAEGQQRLVNIRALTEPATEQLN